jgi:hypothetical protein
MRLWWGAVLMTAGAIVACDSSNKSCAIAGLEGSDAWVQSATDPKCCAPVHNQFSCPADASTEAGACVVVGAIFRDDAGEGQSFPLGCQVNLTFCNGSYEGSPQTCYCTNTPIADGGTEPGWSCGI